MMDPRIEKLARGLVRFSTRVQPGENVLLESTNGNDMLLKALIREVYAAGAKPFVWLRQSEIEHELAKGYTEEQLKLRAENDAALMDRMDVYIGFSAPLNCPGTTEGLPQ